MTTLRQRKFMVELYEQEQSYSNVAFDMEVSVRTVSLHCKADALGVDRLVDYHDHRAREKGFKSYADQLNQQARKKGYDSMSDYYAARRNARAENPQNKIFSTYLRARMKEKGMSAAQVAKEMEVSKNMVAQYCSGKSLPRGNNRQYLFEVLEIPYESIEELVKDVVNNLAITPDNLKEDAAYCDAEEDLESLVCK